jgi:hypothetical protein
MILERHNLDPTENTNYTHVLLQLDNTDKKDEPMARRRRHST